MNMEQAKQTYIAESRGLLRDMEGALLVLENDPSNEDMVATVFRAAHTIKGSAGLFGLDEIVSFTHVAESVLDRLRDGVIVVSKELVGTLLASCDHIRDLIDIVVEAGAMLDDERSRRGLALIESLRSHLETCSDTPLMPASPLGIASQRGTDPAQEQDWRISVQFGPDVLRYGMDPLSFIRYLAGIAEIIDLLVDTAALPTLEDTDPETCYLGFDIMVRGILDRQTLEDVFEFVRDDCELRIERVVAAVADPHPVPPVHDARAGGMSGRASEGQGDIFVDKQRAAQFIRVNAEKLDQLIDRVGELVIAGASASLLAQRLGDAAIQEATAVITHFVEEIREDALQLRMVEIGETFHRFQRLVRDTCVELDKEVVLHISGADTELDKTVIEKIGDPLTHLVRNALDHGIESAESRIAQGKPAQGSLRLNAYHDCGSIVIEVIDDGAGLDREKILAKGIERGLMPADAKPSDAEVFNLIFEPGFSTASKLTRLSGRGVGMDVVKSNIQALRGTVDVVSREGRGTTMRIRLPLTLAIIDGFLVSVGASSYIVPLNMVLECVEFSDTDHTVAGASHYLDLRGEVLPYMRLREQFKVAGPPGRRENVVVVQYGDRRAGLVVDELLGEFQTVIKPLAKMFSKVRGISGSTILGSGEVALILDVPSLIQLVSDLENSALSS